ncbi:MAG: hypothetical protein K9N40_05475 [Candidatus Cloacimonetes bacterium]|nr:hypothetical protein [Candidatus Cloacimonadota bacterium]
MLFSTTWEVKQDGTGDFTSIQEGINASVNSDTVLVYPGTYFENLDFNGKNITLCSLELTTGDPQYITSTIIDGQQQASCIRIHNGETEARIQGFTIQNGFGTLFWSEDGGGILLHDYSTAYVTNCVLKHNISTLGGALYARHGFFYVSGLTITENYSGIGGALYMADDSTITFDQNNRCNIYNNNSGKGADIYVTDTGHVDIYVDTFTVFNPSRFFAQYYDDSTLSIDIQHNWMELEPNDLYVAVDGDDNNSGLSPDEPLRNISWAVRKIQADEQNPRTIHVSAGTYSWAENQQIYPFGCKEYVSIIGEDMDNTILYNDFSPAGVVTGHNVQGSIEISNFSMQNSSDYYTWSVVFFYEILFLKMSNINISNNNNIRNVFASEHVYNEFDNLIITNNTSQRQCSGLLFADNAGFLKNSIIEGNVCDGPNQYGYVVAMQLEIFDDFLVENCKFSNNSTNNTFSHIVRATGNFNESYDITFKNCLFSDNEIASDKVVSCFYTGITSFINCSFTNNVSSSYTLLGCTNLDLTNTIMYNPDNSLEIFMEDHTSVNPGIFTLNVDYSNIRGGIDGVYNQNGVNIINWNVGNIDEEPLFIQTGNDPYQLSQFSPCIDAGIPDTTGLFLPPYDLLHHERIWDGDNNGEAIIDMGCYEFGADSVGVHNYELPITKYDLSNYPNPFNPSTTISFSLPNEITGQAEINIFNLKGQKVKTLPVTLSPSTRLRTSLVEESGINQLKVPRPSTQLRMTQAGNKEYSVVWNGTDDNNKPVSSGIYFALLKAGKIEASCKMLLLK